MSSSRAIFLSYAHEDVDAARRIAHALRAIGLEVWIDVSELRGGDAWDANIRRQIRKCTLFLPIISAQSDARSEGYFRREWRLAIDRTHDMAEGMPFLLPVVVDDTSEADAIVPEGFRSVHWTRLKDGVPDTEFIEHVRGVLEGGVRPPALSHSPATAGRENCPATPTARGSFPWMVAILAGSLVAIAAILSFTRESGWPGATEPAAGRQAIAPVAPASAGAKSIAVLPFRNMSSEAGNEYFCDGVQEDILTQLANIGDLRVVSRTSVMQYRDTTKPIRQIAGELGVAFVLEGSVQRALNKVRVTSQLINALTDEHVWAKSFDRDLTDIFAIQSELAREIAASLRAVLTPEEKSRLAEQKRRNPAAYDILLKARALREELANTREMTEKVGPLFQSAVELDPNFVEAWVDLAANHVQSYFWDFDHTESRLAKAREAIETAVRLAPDSPVVITGLGNYYYYGFRDYDRARRQYEIAERMTPNNADVVASLGYIARREGNWPQAIGYLRRAFELDRRNLRLARDIAKMFLKLHRYDEAIEFSRVAVDLAPDSLRDAYILATTYYAADGSVGEVDAFFATLSEEQRNQDLDIVELLADWAFMRGDAAAYLRITEGHDPAKIGFTGWLVQLSRAMCMKLAGRGDEAEALALKSRNDLTAALALQPENGMFWVGVATAEALLGNNEATLEANSKAIGIYQEARDALTGPQIEGFAACALAWAGEIDASMEIFERLFRTPFGTNVHEARHHVAISPLQKHPRFQEILADPANNAPLLSQQP